MSSGELVVMVVMGLFIIVGFLWHMRNKH